MSWAKVDRSSNASLQVKLWLVLRGLHVFAVDQHQQLADLLGLQSWSIGFGYSYVTEGEREEDLGGGQLIRTG